MANFIKNKGRFKIIINLSHKNMKRVNKIKSSSLKLGKEKRIKPVKLSVKGGCGMCG